MGSLTLLDVMSYVKLSVLFTQMKYIPEFPGNFKMDVDCCLVTLCAMISMNLSNILGLPLGSFLDVHLIMLGCSCIILG